MKEKIKKDRKLLFLFFLLWIAMKAILLQVSREPSMFRTAIGIVGLIILAISAIYVYKMYKWYNSPKAPALVRL